MSSDVGEKTKAGRPREFDVEIALEDAMNVFWRKGYAGTTLPDLIESTGLARGSLYKAFYGKRDIFIAALDLYMKRGIKDLSELLANSDNHLECIRGALIAYARLSQGEKGRLGCMVVATAAEMCGNDDEIAAKVSRMFNRMRDLIAASIISGQAHGHIRRDLDEHQAAQFIVCQIEGMRVVGKAGASRVEMDALVDFTISAISGG